MVAANPIPAQNPPETVSTASKTPLTPHHATQQPNQPNPLATLTAEDADLLRLYFQNARSLFALADGAAKPLLDILHWHARPDIQHAIDTIAASEREGLKAASVHILHQVAAQTDDLVEKRRATDALLRALNNRPIYYRSDPSEPKRPRNQTSRADCSPHSESPLPTGEGGRWKRPGEGTSDLHPASPPDPDYSLLPDPTPALTADETAALLLDNLHDNNRHFPGSGTALLKKFTDPDSPAAKLTQHAFDLWFHRARGQLLTEPHTAAPAVISLDENGEHATIQLIPDLHTTNQTDAPDPSPPSSETASLRHSVSASLPTFSLHLSRITPHDPWLVTNLRELPAHESGP